MKKNTLFVLALMIAASACGDRTITPTDEVDSTASDSASSAKSDEAGEEPTAATNPAALHQAAVTDCYNQHGEGLAEADESAFGEATNCVLGANDALFEEADKSRDANALSADGTLSTISFDMMASIAVLCDAAGPTNARTFIDGSPPKASCMLQQVEDMGSFVVEYGYPIHGHEILAETTAIEVQRNLFETCFAELDAAVEEIYSSDEPEPGADAEAHMELVDCMRARNAAQVPEMVARLDASNPLADEELLLQTLSNLADSNKALCAAAIDSSGEEHPLMILSSQLGCESRFQTRVAQTISGLAYDNYLDNSQ